MSDAVTLTLRAPLDRRLEVDGVTADRVARLTEREIATLPAWFGGRETQLGEFFDVRGGTLPRLRIEGALGHVSGLGAGMCAGELVIDGDAGDRVAARLTGGTVTVSGRVGDDAGMAMAGGTLHVHGGAGDRLASPEPGASRGMTGGEIVIGGSAGQDAAARVRRGLVVVAGDVLSGAARAMIAGTLVVLGEAGADTGRGSRRGSVVAARMTEVPATYRYACTYAPGYIRLLMSYLRRRYGLRFDDALRDGRYERYCGDIGHPGKGEILIHERSARRAQGRWP